MPADRKNLAPRLKKRMKRSKFPLSGINERTLMELEIYPSVFRAETLMENDPETIVLFGPDALTQLGIHFQMEHCETILLVMGGNSSQLPLRMILRSPAFGKPDFNLPRQEGVPPEPDTDDVRAIVETMKKEKPSAVLAVGGGSVMDAAKAAYLSWQTGLDVEELFGVNAASSRFPEKTFRKICAIPTTAGTGSEVTCYSNIVDAESGVKKLISDPAILPEIAAVIPELTLSAPEKLTRETGFDALVHAIESHLNFKAMQQHPEAEEWSLEAIRLIEKALPEALHNPTDSDARACLSAAATLAGMAIRVAPTSLPHLLSYSFCGKTSHGYAVAALLPHFWRYYLTVPEVRERTMALKAFFPGKNAEEVIDSFCAFLHRCGGETAPGKLAGCGTEMIDQLAKDALLNPMKLESAPRPVLPKDTGTVFHEVLDPVWNA